MLYVGETSYTFENLLEVENQDKLIENSTPATQPLGSKEIFESISERNGPPSTPKSPILKKQLVRTQEKTEDPFWKIDMLKKND